MSGDAAATSPAAAAPQRRKWKRSAVFVVTVLISGLCILSLFELHDSGEIQRSQAVRLGQTYPEVEAVMGNHNVLRYNDGGPMSLVFGRAHSQRYFNSLHIQKWTGFSFLSPKFGDWPVEIHFDITGRVDWIRRGRELMKTASVPTKAQ
jgi:hypothetical protein